jgi:hypothetical protein
MPIKIKPWTDINTQRYRDGSGCYVIGNLISRAKDLHVKDMPMDHLNLYHLSINVGKSLKKFVSHMKAVMDADLEYPIILDEDGYVMDGRHRIAKALFEGKETIKYVRFEETPPPDYYEDKKE